MKVFDLIEILWRRKWIILVTTLVAAGGMVVGIPQLPKSYMATAILRVDTVPAGGADFLTFEVPYSERLINTYANIFGSEFVLRQVANSLGLEEVPEVAVSVVAETELLSISARGNDPELPTAVVNRLALLVTSEGSTLLKAWDEAPLAGRPPLQLEDLGRISIVKSSDALAAESGPNRTTLLLLGIFAGLASAIGLALLLDNLDPHLYTAKQFQAVTHLPIITEIPDKKRKNQPNTLYRQPPYEEPFRHLGATVARTGAHVIMVVSAEPKEGKSTVAANLALTLGSMGHRCVLVDADSYCPTQHTIFNLPNERGLSTLLQSNDLDEVVIQYDPESQLAIITNGTIEGSSLAHFVRQLNGDEPATIVQELREWYDYVIVDTPPYLVASHAKMLLHLVDGVLVVMRSAHTTETAAIHLCEELRQEQVNVLGVALCEMPWKPLYHRYYKKAQRAHTGRAQSSQGQRSRTQISQVELT